MFCTVRFTVAVEPTVPPAMLCSATAEMLEKVQLVATLFVGPPTVIVMFAAASPRMPKPRLPTEFWKVVPWTVNVSAVEVLLSR